MPDNAPEADAREFAAQFRSFLDWFHSANREERSEVTALGRGFLGGVRRRRVGGDQGAGAVRARQPADRAGRVVGPPRPGGRGARPDAAAAPLGAEPSAGGGGG